MWYPHNPVVLIFGTLDTKFAEFRYVQSQIFKHGSGYVNVLLADVSRQPTDSPAIDIRQESIRRSHPQPISQDELAQLPRGKLIEYLTTAMTCYVKDLHSNEMIHGIVSLGGSGGTSLAATVMRDALPIGFPKLIVSTMASGDISSFIGQADITMMYSVVDVAGLNSILSSILDNAAAAICGMTQIYSKRCKMRKAAPRKRSKAVALSMFGVTTPAVQAAQKYLESLGEGRYETFVFHATGAGGKAMERLINEGQIDGVLDFTTTELADELVGGVMAGGPDRLTAAASKGIPQIVSVGALDMLLLVQVNFGPPDTVPEIFKGRKFFEHNPNVTLMRTSADENEQLGLQIGQKLLEHSKHQNLVQVWLPTGGVSILSGTDGEFYDADADGALFRAVEKQLANSRIKVINLPNNINEEEFAIGATKALLELMDGEMKSHDGRQ
ncbi:MAG: hypothetical protein M1818_001549 [Claussenomyces sp. TS43310]|nr:MAG: hypothetical protein M1818_001549 [Claussenomyces sp. TS43310]